MSDHLSRQLLEGYRERRLDPAELLALDDHVATCAACRDSLREMQPRRAALLGLRASLQTTDQTALDHPAQEQLLAYVEGRLNEVDRELAESHLEFCPSCAAQAQALRDSAERRAKTVEVSRISTQASSPALWTKFIAALGLSSLRERPLQVPLSLRIGGAVAVMALLVVTAGLWVSNQKRIPEVFSSRPPVGPPPGPKSATPAPILLALNDVGGQITLDAQGHLTGLESLLPADQQRVRTALMTQKVQVPATLRELSDSSSAIMGGTIGTAFALVSPVGTIVATDRPTFRWRPLSRAISYQVTITEPAAGYKEVTASPELLDTKWTVDHPLQRGRLYTWQVTVRTGSAEVKAPAPKTEAKFKVLEQAQADELAIAGKTYSGRHLMLGLLYAEAGLLDEAEGEFQALVGANPGSMVAKNLLRNVRAMQGTK